MPFFPMHKKERSSTEAGGRDGSIYRLNVTSAMAVSIIDRHIVKRQLSQ